MYYSQGNTKRSLNFQSSNMFSSPVYDFPVDDLVYSFDQLRLDFTYPSIMIPFVHANKVDMVVPTIEGLRIGKVGRMDKVYREDHRGKHFQVFIHFEFWDTNNPEACRLRSQISNGETAKIEYERPWFWTLVLNTKVRPPHQDPHHYFPSVNYTGVVPRPPAPPLPPAPRMPIAPVLPEFQPIIPEDFQQFMYKIPGIYPEEKVMIPRTLRMERIGHKEKRNHKKRESFPPQLVAFKEPPPVKEPEPEPEPEPEIIPRKTRKNRNTTDDHDIPKAEIIVPDYGSPEEIQMNITRIKKRFSNKKYI